MAYYFLKISNLPEKESHQNEDLKLIKYLVNEGQEIKKGTPIAIIENDWAVFQVEANGKGFIGELTLKNGSYINVDEPIAVIDCDGEDIPYNRLGFSLSTISQKPAKE